MRGTCYALLCAKSLFPAQPREQHLRIQQQMAGTLTCEVLRLASLFPPSRACFSQSCVFSSVGLGGNEKRENSCVQKPWRLQCFFIMIVVNGGEFLLQSDTKLRDGSQ